MPPQEKDCDTEKAPVKTGRSGEERKREEFCPLLLSLCSYAYVLKSEPESQTSFARMLENEACFVPSQTQMEKLSRAPRESPYPTRHHSSHRQEMSEWRSKVRTGQRSPSVLLRTKVEVGEILQCPLGLEKVISGR